MKTVYYFALVLPVIFGASVASAFDAVLETVPTQYEVITIQNPETEQLILGELQDFPEMFEIVSENPFILSMEIRGVPDNSLDTAPQLNGIIIKQKEVRGVEEIARLNAIDSTWALVTDKVTGLRYQAGTFFSEEVEAGTYRIEISSPNNQGKYMLLVGTNTDDNGYFASLADTKLVYQFYGLSTLRMFSSPYVHYPLGILVLIGLIGGTWYWQRNQKLHA
ncbi:hypothetical protein K2P47_01860 [Patescibacteria group bacterium]|nr:hypothetical protein [Patescibacteria group bacterium]